MSAPDLVSRLLWSGQDAMTKHLSLGMAKLHAEAAAEIERLSNLLRASIAITKKREDQIDRLRDTLHAIESWSRAYPLVAFPEPDFAKAAEVLKAAGITLDAISASNMRHVVEQVGDMAREALANPTTSLPAHREPSPESADDSERSERLVP